MSANKRTSMKWVAVIAILTTMSDLAGCQRNNQVLVPAPITTPDTFQAAKLQDLPYRFLLPRVYDASKKYPLVLFLHGSGHRGTDNEKQLTNGYGADFFLEDSLRAKYPAFVIFPQCPVDQHWENEWGTTRVESLLNDLETRYLIDKTRIYVGGLSNGGTGTYALVSLNPDWFAAAFVIAGHGDESKVSLMTKTKWWVFQGEDDLSITLNEAEHMVDALRKAGATVKFSRYPGVAHESWHRAFAEPTFCQWVFSNHK